MTIATVTTTDELTDLLSDLTEAGCDQVGLLGSGRYDSVQFLVCTDPDGVWWTLNDESGENAEFYRWQDAADLEVSTPTIVFYPSHIVLESSDSETGARP